MSGKTVFAQVRDVLVEQLGVEEDDVELTSHIVNDLNADSLDRVELIMSFEETFGKKLGIELEIPDEEAETIETVQDAVDWLKAHGVEDEAEGDETPDEAISSAQDLAKGTAK